MANTTYTVDENDKRLTDINSQKTTELNDSNKLYQDQINDTDSYFDKQIDAVANWEKTQKEEQQKQTDFAIEKIEQQKGQARSDYLKEQSGAYKDWQKQSNAYGANAEAMAAQGMQNTGFSESSQVSMYNTYQNRVATARESYNRAVLNYDNLMTEARLANSSALAQIAYESLQKQLELSLSGFQYKNTLIQAKADAARQISQDYWTRYNAMYGNIQQENALNETARYHDEQIKIAQEELAWDKTKYWNEHSNTGGDLPKIQKRSTSSGGNKKTTAKVKKSSGAQVKKTSNTKAKKTKSSPTVDMNSVLKLGYGPISASKLNKLVAEGKVKEVEKNGKIQFKKTFNY